MAKIDNIVDVLDAGIKAESLRQKTIANNIANLETPGYRRIEVRFEELLARYLDSSDKADLSKVKAELYQPRDTPVKSNGNDVNYEGEVGRMIKNAIRHKALVRLLNKKYSQLDQAIGPK